MKRVRNEEFIFNGDDAPSKRVKLFELELDDLGIDVLINILINLNLLEIEYLCSVSKAFRKKCKKLGQRFWLSLLIGDFIKFSFLDETETIISIINEPDSSIKRLYNSFAKRFMVTLPKGESEDLSSDCVSQKRLGFFDYLQKALFRYNYPYDSFVLEAKRKLSSKGIEYDDVERVQKIKELIEKRIQPKNKEELLKKWLKIQSLFEHADIFQRLWKKTNLSSTLYVKENEKKKNYEACVSIVEPSILIGRDLSEEIEDYISKNPNEKGLNGIRILSDALSNTKAKLPVSFEVKETDKGIEIDNLIARSTCLTIETSYPPYLKSLGFFNCIKLSTATERENVDDNRNTFVILSNDYYGDMLEENFKEVEDTEEEDVFIKNELDKIFNDLEMHVLLMNNEGHLLLTTNTFDRFIDFLVKTARTDIYSSNFSFTDSIKISSLYDGYKKSNLTEKLSFDNKYIQNNFCDFTICLKPAAETKEELDKFSRKIESDRNFYIRDFYVPCYMYVKKNGVIDEENVFGILLARIKSFEDCPGFIMYIVDIYLNVSYLATTKIGKPLYEALVDVNERKRIYSILPKYLNIDDDTISSKFNDLKINTDPFEHKTIAKLPSHLTNNKIITVEYMRIENKKYFILYDNHANVPYCKHYHTSFEEIKEHFQGEPKEHLCPKCEKEG